MKKLSARTLTFKLLPLVIFTVLLGAAALAGSAGAQGVPASKTYYFTWYDSTPADGMQGDWIIIGNLENSSANVQVFFGDQERKQFNLGPLARQVVSWPNTMGGPVKVVSTGGQALIVTQRVIHNGYFNEVAAIMGSSLDSSYYFTWYDFTPQDSMNGNWVLIANEDTQAAAVNVYIGSSPAPARSFNLAPGQFVTPQFPRRMGGPVHVESAGGQKLLVSQRVLYKNSFNEVMGFPESSLDSVYYFDWYDMTSDFSAGNWVLVSNPNNASVQAQVYIGGGANPRGTYTLGPHQTVTPTYPGLMNGPVRVICTSGCSAGGRLIVSQRMLYKNSFEEVQGTPPAGMDTEMDFGWYDEQSPGMKSWQLISNPDPTSPGAAASVYINSTSPNPIYSAAVPGGGRVTPQFPGVMNGPVNVMGSGVLLASQRVLYNSTSFNELVGLPRYATGQQIGAMMPDLQLLYMNAEWADSTSRQLTVEFRIMNYGQKEALSASVDRVDADNGVTAATPLPVSLGDIETVPSHGVTFSITYHIPPGVQSFHTTLYGHCQDSSGTTYYYPSKPASGL